MGLLPLSPSLLSSLYLALSHTFFLKPFGTEILLASMETCHHLPDSLVDLEFKALEARQQVLTAHTPFHNGIPDILRSKNKCGESEIKVKFITVGKLSMQL